MSMEPAETILILNQFMKDMRVVGMSWSSFIVLATLASSDAEYLSASEIIQETGINRCWVYRSIRVLSRKGLIDTVQQRRRGSQVRALFAVTGKGSFYLKQALMPNGIRTVRAFETRG